MGEETSDDDLRAVAFGRGHSSVESGVAAAELRRRANGLLPSQGDHPDALDPPDPALHPVDQIESAPSEARPVETGRSGRRLGVYVLVTAGLAFALGVAAAGGFSASQDTRPAPASADGPDTPDTEDLTVTSTNGTVLFTLPNGRGRGSISKADEWLGKTQDAQDNVPVPIEYIDPASTHYVGTADSAAGVWVGRGLDGSYCLVIADIASGSSGGSCATPEVFESTGVWTSSSSGNSASDLSAFWNGVSVVLSANR